MTDNHNRVLKVVENGVVTQRQCLTCKSVKSLSEFQKDVHGYMEKKARCRECCNKKYRERDYPRDKSRSGIKFRSDTLLRKYGITYEQAVLTLKNQNGCCANKGCQKEIFLEVPMDLNRAVIDHDHKTGKFRALLCMMCNLTLGKIENDTQQIFGLLEYIENHKTINQIDRNLD